MVKITSPMAKSCQPLIGVSENIRQARELIDIVADSGFNVVITGETGVGKEVVAQNLYFSSPRRNKPFIKINCAALPEGLLESELFGYEEGSFTGADRKKRGKFELAHGGVLFLDEIGDMPMVLQSKLLHVLQTGEFAPLGSESDIKTDAWTIAATNHDLEEDIQNKKFREDLYFRLNIIKIHLSPLRERLEDIPALVNYFQKEYFDALNRKRRVDLNDGLIDKMLKYQWPGNVRELQNILKRVLIMGDPARVIDELFQERDRSPGVVAPEAARPPAPARDEPFDVRIIGLPSLEDISLKDIKKHALARVEKEVIIYVLGKTGWNRTRAAKILKISYKTLLNKIKEHTIEILSEPSDFY